MFRGNIINGGAAKLAVGAVHGRELTVARGVVWEASCELRVNLVGMHGAAPLPSAATGLHTGFTRDCCSPAWRGRRRRHRNSTETQSKLEGNSADTQQKLSRNLFSS